MGEGLLALAVCVQMHCRLATAAMPCTAMPDASSLPVPAYLPACPLRSHRLEICTFLLPHYFLPIGALANAIKGLSWMAGGSTKSVFKARHLCRRQRLSAAAQCSSSVQQHSGGAVQLWAAPRTWCLSACPMPARRPLPCRYHSPPTTTLGM
jgi:hypothetical protein